MLVLLSRIAKVLLVSFGIASLAYGGEELIVQEVYVKASNAERGDLFGHSIAVSGDTMVVGAYKEESAAVGVDGDQSNNFSSDSGAVYVFVRGETTWVQQAYLKASNTDRNDEFGLAVAISGDTIVVGARRESSSSRAVNGDESDDTAPEAGAAYVFVRSGTTWSQEAYLKASNADAGDWFGRAVAISQDTIVVGANLERGSATGVNGDQFSNSAPGSGAAYVFRRSDTSWTQEAILKASNSEAFDQFGSAVSISGDIVVVGAYRESGNATGVNGDQSDNSLVDPGAAYVFKRNGTDWSQEAYLKASNSGFVDQFGFAVSVSGGTVAVGAPYESSNATGVNGNESDDSASRAGAVYLFVRGGTSWTQQAYLKASNPNPNGGDQFGTAVALSDDAILVGSPAEDSGATGVNGSEDVAGASGSGASYFFVRMGTAWKQVAYVKASNTDHGDSFGKAVSLSGSRFVVAASLEDSSGIGVAGDQGNNNAIHAGAAYVFSTPYPFPSPFANFCNGDGGDQIGCTDCPCLNNAPVGTVGGCLNSAATSARLDGSGDPSASLPPGSASDLRFDLSFAPPGSLCILTSGDGIGPGFMGNPCFGLSSGLRAFVFDGLRCVIGTTRRHGARSADALGQVMNSTGPSRAWGGESHPLAGIVGQGGFVAGQTRYFQAIHRDDHLLACMNGLNTSQAVEVVFTP